MQKLIAKLEQNNINPETWSDYQFRKDKFLVRFLKANKNDVDKAYNQFVKFVVSYVYILAELGEYWYAPLLLFV